ncbi:hypothetical protein ALQ57_00233 [Pseudomonas amygdali pv. hibisci]|uniref:Uncharacterized protein n=2 Tax=Pseudomonas amygdali TaxID=47877 RepID=A0AB34UD47_PSEA0|nr:Uncharacterized protein ALO67_04364 [Pseudomonas amygdali pv. hibisci]KPX77292.1 Uncharacterized protein ALO35_02200 [Pseudomonas amygdali pv. lachrymans]KPY76583.1 Uncharacterized protein ALO60_01481 [Pseudomonas amygdali pv. tabaci]RMN52142.1 hypothetical protein ALQ57_00233 [Pseudomonas amygdali pv. hibisci]RMR88045.1 hypothetical protein ALP77_01714 [Pseudomonas amygdali pv. tabaci]
MPGQRALGTCHALFSQQSVIFFAITGHVIRYFFAYKRNMKCQTPATMLTDGLPPLVH